MAEGQNFRELLQYVESALQAPDNVDLVNLTARLEQALPNFLQLLEFKVLQPSLKHKL